MPRTFEQLVSLAVTVGLVMISAIVHEMAHGWAALRCGDPTARDAGRLTLDPRAHLDGLGSLVLPLFMALMGGPVFAFAKPVPYNPRRLRNPRRDELIVALAGPASNLLQAGVGAAALWASWTMGYEAYLAGAMSAGALDWALTVSSTYLSVNLTLCFFNLIPFPPLDGSKVILYFLTGEARRRFYELQRWFMAALLTALYVLPRLFGVDLLGIYLDATAGGLYELIVRAVV